MPGEGEDAVDHDIESDSQQASSSKRLHSLRTTVKDTSEIFEAEPSPGAIEKSNKLLNYQRCSNRITKRSRRDTSPVDPTLKKPVLVKPQAESSAGSKTRRPWELWSVEDKNAFFEAICEYGKDFESIQSYIAQRSKKKGVATNMIKSKDQVRHFYYRTWHKISKYLQVTESVSKQTQELYGLVNYSELRKKIGGCLNEKNRQKLNELVFSGVTTVKLKGKKLRIKTPVCRALKKLNNVADTKEPETEKLPKEIYVEFRPHTNNAWLHVQSLAQNPRVRTKVTLQKRLSSVIEYLQKRWKPYRLKRKEQILSSLPNSLSEGMPCDNLPILRVKPASDTKICPLTLSVMDVASSSDLCLEKYLKLSHKILCKDISKTKKTLCLNQKIQDDKQNDSSEVSFLSEKPNPETVTDCNVKELCIQTENQSTHESLSKPLCETDQLNRIDVELNDHSKSSVTDSSNEENERATELSFNKSLEECYKKSYLMIGHDPQWDIDNLIGQSVCESEENSKQKNILQRDLFSPKSLQHREKNTVSDYTHDGLVEKLAPNNSCDSIYHKTVCDGWTVEEPGLLTFGELYLLLGKPTTIVLEYEFESSDSVEDYSETQSISAKKNMLSKVLEVAQNYFVDTKNKQKLLPGTRRGCRVRRKPLVVQRPLLPPKGMPRPMTFVHIVPSLSSLTNVIPSNNAESENKISMPSAKNIMQIIPSGLPIQVPIVKQVHAETSQKLVLQQNTLPISHATVNSTSGSPMQIINDQRISQLNTGNSPANSYISPMNENTTPPEEIYSLISFLRLPSPPNLDMANLDSLSESQSNSLAPEDTFSTMQQISTILDVSNSSTFSNITPADKNSFVEELGFSTKNKHDTSSGLTSFSENQLTILKRNTPPSSPLDQSFKINSPDMQWFNGEIKELCADQFVNIFEEKLSNMDERSQTPSAGLLASQNSIPQNNGSVVTCFNCLELFQNAEARKKHLTNEDKIPLTTFKCDSCGMLCPSKCHLEAHIRFHIQVSPYICPECGDYPDNNWNKFNEHVRYRCFHFSRNISYICPTCKRIFRSSELMLEHMVLHTKSIASVNCIRAYSSLPRFEKHIKDVDWDSATDYSSNSVHRTFNCSLCDIVCTSHKERFQHLSTHLKDLVYKYVFNCTYCEKFFESKALLLEHIKQCHGKGYKYILNEDYSGNFIHSAFFMAFEEHSISNKSKSLRRTGEF